ncbi:MULTISPECIES: SgcJ/EcaC family oxidoreductase [unclassified Thioalkalivibrio]|uniref:SgcJ/EcaC family oxidoreductase n=1 Tax=unclassified Thioalkalivibrio TaxID=2621013 RepID=UPI0003A84371|nr:MULTISPECIES: SgcJ/EcaC family oxidoreductase [unclassified Thioalkalivibrio]
MSRKWFLLAALPLAALTSTHAWADPGEIQRILEAKEAAWEAGDGEAWARDYQEDAGLVNLFGTRFNDRATNAKRHTEVLQGPFAGTSLSVDVQDITMLSDDTAFAEALLRVSNIASMPAGLPDRGDGVLHTRMSFLLEHDGHHGWQIRFGQNTAVHR